MTRRTAKPTGPHWTSAVMLPGRSERDRPPGTRTPDRLGPGTQDRRAGCARDNSAVGTVNSSGPALIEHFDGRKWTATQQPFNRWQQNVTALAQVNRGPNTYRGSGTGITVVGMSTANSAYVGALAEHICPGQ